MRATVGENVEVICSDNVNLAQLFLNEGIIETADAKKKKELWTVFSNGWAGGISMLFWGCCVRIVEESKWITVVYPNSIIFCVLENEDF